MPMQEERKKLKKYVAGFGAAVAATAAVPEAGAEIMGLTPNPGSVATSDYTFVKLQGASLGPNAYDFWQTNASEGKTLRGVSFYKGVSYDTVNLNISGFAQVSLSQLITSGIGFAQTLTISTDASGTATYAFRTNANELGWIRMDLGGTGGVVTYLAAAFNDTPGGSIDAGEVPEPSTGALAALAGLALGAQSVRRRRNRDRS